jgi:ATP-dependent Clp protease protease subunit
MTDITEIEKQILEDRVIFFTGDFDEENCDILIKKLLYLQNKDIKTITIYLDSYGGYVTDFFKVYDILNTIKCNVNIIATGKASSAGGLLLLSGTKRYAHKHTAIMLHELSGSSGYSKLSEQKLSIEHNIKLQQQMNEIILNKTKLTKKDLIDYKFKDIYFTAEEALKVGIIDEIIE